MGDYFKLKFSDIIMIILTITTIGIACITYCVAKKTLDLGATLQRQDSEISYLIQLDSESRFQLIEQKNINRNILRELDYIARAYALSVERNRIIRTNDSAIFMQYIDTVAQRLGVYNNSPENASNTDINKVADDIASIQEKLNDHITPYNEYVRTSNAARKSLDVINSGLDQMRSIMRWPLMGDNAGKMRYVRQLGDLVRWMKGYSGYSEATFLDLLNENFRHLGEKGFIPKMK